MLEMLLNRYSNIYLLADDAKIAKKITKIKDCEELQCDIDSFIEWSVRSGLDLNLTKCNSITFSHAHTTMNTLLLYRP